MNMTILQPEKIIAEAGQFTEHDRKELQGVVQQINAAIKENNFNETGLFAITSALRELLVIHENYVERLLYVAKRSVKL